MFFSNVSIAEKYNYLDELISGWQKQISSH